MLQDTVCAQLHRMSYVKVLNIYIGDIVKLVLLCLNFPSKLRN